MCTVGVGVRLCTAGVGVHKHPVATTTQLGVVPMAMKNFALVLGPGLALGVVDRAATKTVVACIDP